MINIGKMNPYTVKKVMAKAVLTDMDGQDFIIAKGELPPNVKEGDTGEAFVYNDKKDSLKATTTKPYAQVGEFALLPVVDVTKFGAFLAWGIQKDLFLPQKLAPKDLKVGQRILVFVSLDVEKKGVIATSNIQLFIQDPKDRLKEKDEVDILIYKKTDLGYAVIVNHRYSGLIFNSDAYQKIKIGEKRKAYVKKIRPDGKLDISLGQPTYRGRMSTEKEKLLEILKMRKGFLPLTDNSDPERIKDILEMSKRSFKAAAGMLKKEGKLEITDRGIKLIED